MSKCLTYTALAQRMAKEMKAKMALNAYAKTGWQEVSRNYAIRRLLEEVGEFVVHPSWSEAADVANFAAMLANVEEET